jgi:cytochrome P450
LGRGGGASFAEEGLSKLVASFARHGDAYRTHSPAIERDLFVFSHPDHVRHVLVDNTANYRKGIGIERVAILLGNGLMTSEPPLWHTQRRLIQPAFHRADRTARAGHDRGEPATAARGKPRHGPARRST